MAPNIKDDIQRYLRYGWSAAIVLRLIERKYGIVFSDEDKKKIIAIHRKQTGKE